MTNLTNLHVTDGLTQVLATQYNRVVDAVLRGDMANMETLSANKTLVDADYPFQVYAPTAARDVMLPAVAAANHPFYIVNTSGSFVLTVKNAGGSTIGTLGISGVGIFASDGTAWRLLTSWVTNGDAHDHAGGDGAQIAYSGLSGLPTLPAGAIVGTTDNQVLTNKTMTRPTSTNSAETHQTLTDGGTIAWDMDNGASAQVTLGAAGRTMAAPSHLRAGATYLLLIIQDGTGSRTITTWNAVFKWASATAPILSTAANAKDFVSFWSDGTNLYGGTILKDVK